MAMECSEVAGVGHLTKVFHNYSRFFFQEGSMIQNCFPKGTSFFVVVSRRPKVAALHPFAIVGVFSRNVTPSRRSRSKISYRLCLSSKPCPLVYVRKLDRCCYRTVQYCKTRRCAYGKRLKLGVWSTLQY